MGRKHVCLEDTRDSAWEHLLKIIFAPLLAFSLSLTLLLSLCRYMSPLKEVKFWPVHCWCFFFIVIIMFLYRLSQYKNQDGFTRLSLYRWDSGGRDEIRLKWNLIFVGRGSQVCLPPRHHDADLLVCVCVCVFFSTLVLAFSSLARLHTALHLYKRASYLFLVQMILSRDILWLFIDQEVHLYYYTI